MIPGKHQVIRLKNRKGPKMLLQLLNNHEKTKTKQKKKNAISPNWMIQFYRTVPVVGMPSQLDPILLLLRYFTAPQICSLGVAESREGQKNPS